MGQIKPVSNNKRICVVSKAAFSREQDDRQSMANAFYEEPLIILDNVSVTEFVYCIKRKKKN
jgi:hypothetical protein